MFFRLFTMNVAIIGYGYWGPNLVRNFWKNQNFTVTHVVDFENSKLKLVNRDYPTILTTTNYNDILKFCAWNRIITAISLQFLTLNSILFA